MTRKRDLWSADRVHVMSGGGCGRGITRLRPQGGTSLGAQTRRGAHTGQTHRQMDARSRSAIPA